MFSHKSLAKENQVITEESTVVRVELLQYYLIKYSL